MNLRVSSPRVTLADVASHAGVSITTVSVILSGREESLRQFHPDTISRVRRSAARLGYHANLFASGLPNKASPFFALVIRDIGTEPVTPWHHWAFEGDLLGGCMSAASEAGLYPIVVTTSPSADEAALAPVRKIIDGGVFGSIVRTPNLLLEKHLRLRTRQKNRVIIAFPDRFSRWPNNAIDLDNATVGALTAEMLARQGRRRWGIVHYRDRRPRESHLLRRSAFQRIARERGATVEIVELPRKMEDLRPLDLTRLKRLKPDGIFAIDSVLSIDVLQACGRIGMRPGEDFHLVGCNVSRWQHPPYPTITSIDVSWREVGVMAVQKLLDLAGSGECVFESVAMHPRIVPADTCPVPADLLPAPPATAAPPAPAPAKAAH